MNLSEIRAKYPQYDSISDDVLVKKLHDKYYPDMDIGEFSNRVGYSKNNTVKELPMSLEEAKRQADELHKRAGIDTSWKSVLDAGAEGFGKGYLGGAERVLNGASLGGYDWLSDKVGLGSKERSQELKDIAGNPADVAMGATDFTGGLLTGAGLFKGASALAKAIPHVTKAGKIAFNTANLAKYPLTGAIEGGLNAGFTNDSLDSAKEGAVTGGVAGSVVPAVLFGAGKLGSKALTSLLGKTTGSGERSVKQAYDAGKRGSQTFIENMRGTSSKEDVVGMAKKSLNDLKISKNAEYAKAMEGIKGKEGVKLEPIVDKFKEISNSEAGGKKYLVDEDTSKFLKKAGEKISAFQKDKSVKTLSDFDNLKQSIGNINVGKDARRASQVQGELYRAIKDEIKKQAPIYDEIMKPYSQASEQIRNIEKALSLGKNAEIDTTLRKLQSSFRNTVASNYGNRADLLNKLGNKDLSDAIAGQLMNTYMPRGLTAQVTGAGLGGYGLYGGLNPSALATLPAFMPRVVGEGAYALGRLSNQVGKIAPETLRKATLLDIIGQMNRKGE